MENQNLNSSTLPPPLSTGTRQKPSGVAKASFIIGLSSITISIAATVTMVAFMSKNVGINHKFNHSDFIVIIAAGFVILSTIPLNIIGLILGLMEIKKTISNKWMAVTGVAVNGSLLIFTVGLQLINRVLLHHPH